jgi:XisH protein
MAKDKYHEDVKIALLKEGWTITQDPLYVETAARTLEIDLGAERLIGAERNGEKIAVEIKSFLGVSEIHDFYKALGQFNYYFLALRRQEPERILFLAVPVDTYETFFQEPLTIEAIEFYNVKIVVYNSDIQIIETWKS